MTTPNEARQLIYAAARDLLTVQLSAEQFVFDSETFEPPHAPDNPDDGAWCRVFVREALSLQSTLGSVENRRFDRQATTYFEIHTPQDFGTAKGDDLVRAIRGAFEGVSIRDAGREVHFTNVQVLELGIEGAEWRVNVLASFWFEERK